MSLTITGLARQTFTPPHTLAMNPPWCPQADSGFRELIRAIVVACLMAAPILAAGALYIHSYRAEEERVRLADIEVRKSHDRLIAAAPMGLLPVDAVVRGHTLFSNTCAACHKADGTGLPDLGMDLTKSWFVASLDDSQLHQFIVNGRPWAKPTVMPPRGGNPALTDTDLNDIIAFVRVLQDSRRVQTAELAAAEEKIRLAAEQADAQYAAARAAKKAAAQAVQAASATQPTQGTQVAAAGAAAEDEYDQETITYGGELFVATCSACHGKDGKGLPKNGKDLVHSQFAKGLSNEKLIEFVLRGRDTSDPANTTKIVMPPRGGNPALNEEKIEAIVAYVRSLQKAEGPSQ